MKQNTNTNKEKRESSLDVRRRTKIDTFMERGVFEGKGKKPFIDFGIVGETSSDTIRAKYPKDRIHRMSIFDDIFLADGRLIKGKGV